MAADPESAGWPARVILTGFRATGKSAVGKQLAERIGYRFLDTDGELVSSVHCSIAEFVREHGWKAFREKEQELLEHLACMHKIVISTGGGAVLHKQAWQKLREQGLVVWLQADARTISERLLKDPVSVTQRPSLTGNGTHEEVAEILAQRESSYREGSDLAIDTTDKSPEEIAILVEHVIRDKEKV